MRQPLTALLFDAGGVLLHPNLDWLIARLADAGIATDRGALHHAYYRMVYAADMDPSLDRRGVALGSLEVRIWIVTRLMSGAGIPAEKCANIAPALAEQTLVDFPGEGDIFCWAMPGLREALSGLAQRGFLLGVASNNDGSLERQLQSVGVSDLFAVRLDSALEGVSKPDPELLLRAAAGLGVAPAECLYVGDIDRVDGAAARAAGMHFALLDPLRQERRRELRYVGALTDILKHFRPHTRGDRV